MTLVESSSDINLPPTSDRQRVHVVIPAYNAASTVCRAIASALDQREIDISVHVVDNGSTDGTKGEVERWSAAPNLHIWHLERKPKQRKTASFPLAFALEKLLNATRSVSTDWFLRLDADDVLASSTCISDLLKAAGSRRLMFGRIVFFESSSMSAETYTVAPQYRTLSVLLKGAAYSAPHHAGLIRCELLSQVLTRRGFLFDLTIGYGEDLDLTLALLRECEPSDCAFDDSDVCFKQLDGETVSLTTHPLQIAKDHLRIFQRHRLVGSSLALRSGIDLSCQALGLQRSALRRKYGFPGRFWAESLLVSNEQLVARLAQLGKSCL